MWKSSAPVCFSLLVVYTMGLRTDLHEILEGVLGSEHVYFQPPATVQMVYPCIVYARFYGKTIYASDNPYVHDVQYRITVIDKDPDSAIPGKVAMLAKCVVVTHFVADNLNHDVYNLYF